MKRIIITEEEKKHILSLHQNLNIKGILQEELKGDVYTTENDQRIYYGTNTSFDYVDIKKGTTFTRAQGGATSFGGKLVFSCSRVGTVKFDNGTGNKHFTYNNKTYWANALQKKLISVFCSSSSSSNTGCLKGNCKNGYGEYRDPKGGGSYKGNYKNGKFEGYGVLIITREDNMTTIFGYSYWDGIYSGNWVNGALNGTGKQVDLDGKPEYYGNFKDSKWDGKGKYDYKDGSYLWGTWSNDLTTDQTYYKNIKGCYFKGKGGEGSIKLSNKRPDQMDEIPCTPGQWIDLEKPQTPVGSNQGGNNNSGSNQGGNNNSGSNQGGQKLCSKWNNCTNKSGSTTNYVRCDWCSEIGRLQGCLRDESGNPLKADKAWGKNTEAALNKLGYNGTDGVSSENITKICDDLLANQTKFNPGDFGDGSDENFPPPQPI